MNVYWFVQSIILIAIIDFRAISISITSFTTRKIPDKNDIIVKFKVILI